MNRALGDFAMRAGYVLIAFPPARPKGLVHLISSDLDTWLGKEGIEESQRILKLPSSQWPAGKVVQIGPDTDDVWPGDLVLLEPEASAELIEWPDTETGLPIPHLVVREEDISAIVERT